MLNADLPIAKRSARTAVAKLGATRVPDRSVVSRAKSDHADAMTLANILRTDAAAHRPLAADTPLVQAIAVLARAQQDAAWNRTQLSNQLRSPLRRYFPAGIDAFNLKKVSLTSREARTILAAAATPTAAAKLTTDDLGTLLHQAGRTRNMRSADQKPLAELCSIGSMPTVMGTSDEHEDSEFASAVYSAPPKPAVAHRRWLTEACQS
jgi:hypothetical protein